MSKYVEFKVRAYYDKKTGAIKLITKDSLLHKQPFQVTLTRDSESFQSLIKLLEENNSISKDSLLKALPDYALLPNIYENDNESFIYEGSNPKDDEEDLEFLESVSPDEVFEIGKTSEKEEIFITLTPGTHTLITGPTGSGKTQFLRTIAAQMIQKGNTRIVSINKDTAGSVTSGLKLAEDDLIANSLVDVTESLLEVEEDIFSRLELIENNGVSHWAQLPLERIALLIDGLAPFTTSRVEDSYVDKLLRGKIKSSIKNIASLGKRAGVHLFIADQILDSKTINGETKANIGRRIVFGNNGPDADRMTLGTKPKFSDDLRDNPGRGIIRLFGNEPKLFQSYIVDSIVEDEKEF